MIGSVAESVDAPDLKSVEHYARGSSSLPTPIINNKLCLSMILVDLTENLKMC